MAVWPPLAMAFLPASVGCITSTPRQCELVMMLRDSTE